MEYPDRIKESIVSNNISNIAETLTLSRTQNFAHTIEMHILCFDEINKEIIAIGVIIILWIDFGPRNAICSPIEWRRQEGEKESHFVKFR